MEKREFVGFVDEITSMFDTDGVAFKTLITIHSVLKDQFIQSESIKEFGNHYVFYGFGFEFSFNEGDWITFTESKEFNRCELYILENIYDIPQAQSSYIGNFMLAEEEIKNKATRFCTIQHSSEKPNYLEKIKNTKIQGLLIANVGQGNLSMTEGSIENYFNIMFDCGGGAYGNEKTYKKSQTFDIEIVTDAIVIISHFHADHYETLRRWLEDIVKLRKHIKTVFYPQQARSLVAAQVLSELANAKIELIELPNSKPLQLGEITLSFGKGKKKNINDNGIICSINNSQCNILLPGDCSPINFDSQTIKNITTFEYIIFPHHGGIYKRSIGKLPTNCEYIFSFGYDNTYGHPRQDVLKSLKTFYLTNSEGSNGNNPFHYFISFNPNRLISLPINYFDIFKI